MNTKASCICTTLFFPLILSLSACSEVSKISESIIKIKSSNKTRASTRHFIIANEKKDKNQLIEAISDLDKAIELNPEYSEAFSLRSEIKFRLGKNTSACRDVKDALLFGNNQLLSKWINSQQGSWCKNSQH